MKKILYSLVEDTMYYCNHFNNIKKFIITTTTIYNNTKIYIIILIFHHLKCKLSHSMFASLLLTIINHINSIVHQNSMCNQLSLMFPKLMNQYNPNQIIQCLYNNKLWYCFIRKTY